MRTPSVPRRPFPGRAVGGIILAASVLACPGCSSQDFSAPRAEMKSTESSGAIALAPVTAEAPPSATPTRTPADASKGEPEVPPAAARKIIYSAQVTLIVESLTGFNARFERLVRESGGYVSQTDQSSQADAQRSASWTVRVPVDRFTRFLASITELGELQRSHLDSQDVTMEYYDLEARIKNKQEEEKRLIKHLADSTGKLEDILAVERELTRVRGEVEQMQGRIRYLGNMAALSTVVLTVSEVRNYVPPVRPTFAGQVARTFRESLESLVDVGKAVTLFVVALVPWLPVLLVLALLILWAGRKVFRRRPPVVLTRSAS